MRYVYIGSQPTDTTTLIPFIKSIEEHLNFKYLKIVADAGYESEENSQLSFIKSSNYEISKTRKYQNDIIRIENMELRRFLCRGENKVYAESVILALSHNINKLHNKIQSSTIGLHLFELTKTA